MKNHVLVKSVGSQYGNQFHIAFRCGNLHSFLAKFILLNCRFCGQFYSLSPCLKMSRFPKSRSKRLRIVSVGNSLLILVGIDLNQISSF